jgi:hypothetical protein
MTADMIRMTAPHACPCGHAEPPHIVTATDAKLRRPRTQQCPGSTSPGRCTNPANAVTPLRSPRERQ